MLTWQSNPEGKTRVIIQRARKAEQPFFLRPWLGLSDFVIRVADNCTLKKANVNFLSNPHLKTLAHCCSRIEIVFSRVPK